MIVELELLFRIDLTDVAELASVCCHGGVIHLSIGGSGSGCFPVAEDLSGPELVLDVERELN